MNITEAIGYLGSLLILISMTRTSIVQLRIIGLAGSLAFVVYGLLIEAYPIALVNAVITGVHLFFLRKLLSKRHELFRTLELNKDSQFLRYFLEFYSDDIEAHQPGFVFEATDDQVRVLILRDMAPAGVFIGRLDSDGSIEVQLDYVAPPYRDFKVAEFLYSDRSGVFGRRGVRRIWTRPGNDEHVRYFERLGFRPAVLADGDVLMADLESLLKR